MSSTFNQFVRRLLPRTKIPDVPKHEKFPTPSGWRPPTAQSSKLAYYVTRDRYHMYPLYLRRRRDDLDTKTLEYNYAEVVTVGNVEGDIFACEEDLRSYLEQRLNQKVATNVDELQGKVHVKGADRSLLEKFLMEKGF